MTYDVRFTVCFGQLREALPRFSLGYIEQVSQNGKRCWSRGIRCLSLDKTRLDHEDDHSNEREDDKQGNHWGR